jgi:hypothetical protein
MYLGIKLLMLPLSKKRRLNSNSNIMPIDLTYTNISDQQVTIGPHVAGDLNFNPTS